MIQREGAALRALDGVGGIDVELDHPGDPHVELEIRDHQAPGTMALHEPDLEVDLHRTRVLELEVGGLEQRPRAPGRPRRTGQTHAHGEQAEDDGEVSGHGGGAQYSIRSTRLLNESAMMIRPWPSTDTPWGRFRPAMAGAPPSVPVPPPPPASLVIVLAVADQRVMVPLSVSARMTLSSRSMAIPLGAARPPPPITFMAAPAGSTIRRAVPLRPVTE